MARMQPYFLRASILVTLAALPTLVLTQSGGQVSDRAKQLHDRAIVIDSHDDTTQRLVYDKTFKIEARNTNGNVDMPRMREGGLDALFFSIWVPSDVTGPPAVKKALDQIDAVREAVRLHPNDLVLATTAAEVRRAAADHKIAALMGMEGGHMIDDDMRLLRDYAALGVRYLTLTHFKNNNHAGFLSEEFRVASEKKSGNIVAKMAAMSKKCGGNEACTTMEGERIDHEAMMSGELPKVSWEKIIDHIDHAVKVAGADHVGLGSDFDGATMPIGMEDASKLPRITDALLKKGYSEADVQKILGGNILRVMEQVERVAQGGGKAPTTQR